MTQLDTTQDGAPPEGAALVGPLMQAGEMADLVADAIAEDNPGAEVLIRDQGSFIRIHTPGVCRLTRQTLSELAGRPLRIGDVEPHMAFFAGHITTTTDEMIWRSGQSAARPAPVKGEDAR
ncbi:MmoB/DmpM family protein [Amycolatopsis sp. NPDC005232]|uniref:MmoB/DmpM family protein n=1 Tax=Amycolatopsis sp. NPDC005232 TaxID=3157027 RepID=UPI0033BC1A66